MVSGTGELKYIYARARAQHFYAGSIVDVRTGTLLICYINIYLILPAMDYFPWSSYSHTYGLLSWK